MYDSAPQSERPIMFSLFGVRYARQIGVHARQIVQAAGFQAPSYVAYYTREVYRGMRLGRYVTVKPEETQKLDFPIARPRRDDEGRKSPCNKTKS